MPVVGPDHSASGLPHKRVYQLFALELFTNIVSHLRDPSNARLGIIDSFTYRIQLCMRIEDVLNISGYLKVILNIQRIS